MGNSTDERFYIRKQVERDLGSGRYFIFVTLYKKRRFFRKKVSQLSDCLYWNERHRLTERVEQMAQQLRDEAAERRAEGLTQNLRDTAHELVQS